MKKFLFAKEYKSNEDIKYVVDRVLNTFATSITVSDLYKEIGDYNILKNIPKPVDPNKIYPMTYSQRLERGDYRIFEPNERDINKKYYEFIFDE